MLTVHGWLLIGIAYTAAIHMLGSSVLFLKSFQCEKGLGIYGFTVSTLAVLALGAGAMAGIGVGAVLLTAVLALLCISQPIVLSLPEQSFSHRKFWLATNSSLVALLAFVLAKQIAVLVG